MEPPVGMRWASHHRGKFGGKPVRYDAIAETTPVGEPGQPASATFFSVSYEAVGHRRPDRPVLFAFNGGPGSSSIWLHMGFLGPRSLKFRDDLHPETTPPFQLTDNPDSPLDVADIVLIDPPGTGLAQLAPGTNPDKYYGVQNDAVAFARFIRQWCVTHRRTNAPKYLLGESYGTVRVALLADMLAGDGATGEMDGVTFNGLVLMGQALYLPGARDGDRRYLTTLPAFAAAAWYHHVGAREAHSAREAQALGEAFVRDQYMSALFAGDRLAPPTRAAIIARMSALTGLKPELIDHDDLRIGTTVFATEMLKTRTLGLYDARYTLPTGIGGFDTLADDASMTQYTPGFVAAIATYLSDELAVPVTRPYVAIDFARINQQWDWGGGKGVPSMTNYAPHLESAMRRNPSLRVLVLSGRYDLVTPPSEADYVIAHAGLPRDRVTLIDYDAGHMLYLGGARPALGRDLRAFLSPTNRSEHP